MPRYKDETAAVRVYTVCDESKYLIVRNVPALGCQEELKQLFEKYGEVEDCKPMDAEDCEAYTDVFWIKFCFYSNARFAKRKLDEYVFLGNRLQVSYAPDYESVHDTQEKLEGRRKEVLARLNPGRSLRPENRNQGSKRNSVLAASSSQPTDNLQKHFSSITRVSSGQDYFPSQSMNETVRTVRDKLNKIEASAANVHSGPSAKKARVDNRRRI